MFHPLRANVSTFDENTSMISAFASQASSSPANSLPPHVRPVAKAIHTPNQSLTARWVPINRSFIALTKIILRSAQERLQLANLAITLRCVTQQGYKHLILVNDDQDVQMTAAGCIEEIIISTDMPMSPASERMDARHAVTLPVDLNQQRLVYLLATPPLHPESTQEATTLVQQLAAVNDEFIGIVKRYQTRYRAIYVYGDQCYWIGNSQALRQLDQRISQLANLGKPVLVTGNKGSGKIIAARALHCERHTDMVPFIESNCAQWQAGAATSILQSLYYYANKGTLFLRNIDKLPESEHAALQAFITHTVNQALANLRRPPVDLIMSISERDADIAASHQQWLKQISTPLNLPDLNDRTADIRDLIHFFARVQSGQQDLQLSEHVWQQLEKTTWPCNVDDLKRLIEQAALATGGKPINDPVIKHCMAQHPTAR